MPEFNAKEIGIRLRRDHEQFPRALRRAVKSGMHRARRTLVKASPVDMALLRRAWKVVEGNSDVSLLNDQPYAGVMEAGARPFKISIEGRAALARWAFRQLRRGKFKRRGGRSLEDEAVAIAWAISKKFEAVGIKGKKFVWANLPKIQAEIEQEIERSLGKFFNRSRG